MDAVETAQVEMRLTDRCLEHCAMQQAGISAHVLEDAGGRHFAIGCSHRLLLEADQRVLLRAFSVGGMKQRESHRSTACPAPGHGAV